MKRVVITGGAGFIGSHLCKRFIEEGFEVICIDNLLTGNIDNVSSLFETGRFIFIKMDITNYIHVPGPVEMVLHFASPASPADYLKYPIQTLKVGSLGTHKALGLSKEKKAKFLLASTSEVYGDPHINPQHEGYCGNVDPVSKRGVYDEAKRFAEALTMAYHRYHGLDTRIVRIFNTYGPNMRVDDGRAIPNFITQALKGEDITIYGDGSQTRSFCYIDDMVEAIIRITKCDYQGPLNIGNPEEMRIIDLAKIILKMTKSKSRIVFRELPEGDPKVRRPEISLARRLLGWEPKVKIEEGIEKTIYYFKRRLGL